LAFIVWEGDLDARTPAEARCSTNPPPEARFAVDPDGRSGLAAWRGAEPPPKLTAAREAWATWFGSWFASHWGPEDVPGLRLVVRFYDAVERGDFVRHGELRVSMDGYGITPKGQQMRRWLPPAAGEVVPMERGESSRYAHLAPVPGPDDGA
jgi:hypothetical protein